MDTGRLMTIMITICVVLFVIQASDPTFSIGANTPISTMFNISSGTSAQLSGNTPFGQMAQQLNTTEINSGALDYSISVWGMVKSFLGFIYQFFFAPTAILNAIQAPWQITLIMSVVWGVLWLLGVMSLVWRWDI
jgi:hypothetical protein